MCIPTKTKISPKAGKSMSVEKLRQYSPVMTCSPEAPQIQKMANPAYGIANSALGRFRSAIRVGAG